VFWEAINSEQKEVLKKIVADLPIKNSYLAGDTGLALLLGHRKSIDFDWFTPAEFEPAELENKLASSGNLKVLKSKAGTFHALLDQVRVTWLYYTNPLIQPPLKISQVPGLKIASLADIGVMKWIAISQRGTKKDFIDLYFILQEGLTLGTLITYLPEKFPQKNLNFYHLIRSLSYFEDAEKQQNLQMLKQVSWQQVKSFFTAEKNRLLDVLINDYGKDKPFH